MAFLSALFAIGLENTWQSLFRLVLLHACTLLLASMIVVVFVVFCSAPRLPLKSEKLYSTTQPGGEISKGLPLPCWFDDWNSRQKIARKSRDGVNIVQDAEIFISVVVPAFNEEGRLQGMLEKAVPFLQQNYGYSYKRDAKSKSSFLSDPDNDSRAAAPKERNQKHISNSGWEIIVVSDGSTDKTADCALTWLNDKSTTGSDEYATSCCAKVPHGSIRVVSLEKNRGKGGAVTHGMRHVRGEYVLFADADGASRFEDLTELVNGCRKIEDKSGRGVAIGSRAHLVKSDAVVQRSWLRNFLMHSFHLLLRFLTSSGTAKIRDTQCGFKLFSRPALPYIVPYMHSEGWIFDVEMLMLVDSASIPVIEVEIGWQEVGGSKLKVLRDSLAMAWDLVVLRSAWFLGIYPRNQLTVSS